MTGVASTDQPRIMSCLVECLSSKTTRLIDIDIWRLVHNMITSFYEHPSACASFTWFVSSGDLPAMVYNFLRTRDCFLDAFPRPCLSTTLSYEHSETELHILGNVEWQPPDIGFHKLPIMLSSGAEYRIEPTHNDVDLGNICGPRFSKFPCQPEFAIQSDSLPLKWDHDLRCFRAIVPGEDFGSPVKESRSRSTPTFKVLQAHLRSRLSQDFLLKLYTKTKIVEEAKTTFSAKLITRFPSNVRFERTSRYIIKLEILEPRTSARGKECRGDSLASNPESLYGVGSSAPESHRADEVPPYEEPIRATPTTRARSWLPSYSNAPASERGCRIADDQASMPLDSSPDTSSVDRDIEAARTLPQQRPLPPGVSGSPGTAKQEQDSRAAAGKEDTQLRPEHAVFAFDGLCLSSEESNMLKESTQAAARASAAKRTIEPDMKRGVVPFTTRLAEVARHAVPKKRKASKQVPLSSMFESSSAFQSERLALDKFEHLDLEIGAKRQRINDSKDSSIALHASSSADVDAEVEIDWDDEHMSNLAKITTRCLGKAATISSPAAKSPGWYKRLSERMETCDEPPLSRSKSRAYEATDSNVMPSLRKRGSVKRMVFPRHKKYDSASPYPTPGNSADSASDSDRSMNQFEIVNNYLEFRDNREKRGQLDGATSEDSDERKAYESIFMEDSQEEGWSTEASNNEVSDMSADFERVSLVAS